MAAIKTEPSNTPEASVATQQGKLTVKEVTISVLMSQVHLFIPAFNHKPGPTRLCTDGPSESDRGTRWTKRLFVCSGNILCSQTGFIEPPWLPVIGLRKRELIEWINLEKKAERKRWRMGERKQTPLLKLDRNHLLVNSRVSGFTQISWCLLSIL